MDKIALSITWDPLPSGLESLFTCVESWERMGFGVEYDLIERQNVVRAKQQIEVFEGFGLCDFSIVKRRDMDALLLTSQKDSMLSLVLGGTALTSLIDVKPPPSSTMVCFTNASNISHPHSR